MSDISLDVQHFIAARAANQSRFVVLRVGDRALELVSGADVLVLRDPSGRLLPARFAGVVARVDALGEDEHEIAGAYRIDAGGMPLSRLVGNRAAIATSGGHGWGAMGLPNGPLTRVSPLENGAEQNDLMVAMQSAGYRMGVERRTLSISPGERVTAGPHAGTAVSVDRRARSLEVRLDNGETIDIAFDEVDDLEAGE